MTNNEKRIGESMYYLGIDLGTSSVKVLVINDQNEIVGDATREYPVFFSTR